jgi:hypothetical protein
LRAERDFVDKLMVHKLLQILILAFGIAANPWMSAKISAGGIPRAIIEDIDAQHLKLEFMDYVFKGQEIVLKAKGSISLSYLSSCTQEHIVGGQLVIGIQQSEIKGGSVKRRKIPCPSSKLALTKSQSKAAGVIAFRAPPKKKKVPNRRAARTLMNVSPLIEVGVAKKLLVERLNPLNVVWKINLVKEKLFREKFFDLADAGMMLAPGNLYRVSIDDKKILLRVVKSADSNRLPLIRRLVRLTVN